MANPVTSLGATQNASLSKDCAIYCTLHFFSDSMTRRPLHGGGRPSLTPARSQVEKGKQRLIRFVQVGRGKRFAWNYHFTYVM